MTYRLYPTAVQGQHLGALLESQRVLYNAALEERRGAWRWEGRAVSWVDQFKELTGLEARLAIPSLDVFGVQPHRGTLKRLDDAFAGFFRRAKMGGKAGFPRFRSKKRFDSITYPTAQGWGLYPTGTAETYGRLRLPGVGHVKIRLAHGPRARKGTATKLVLRRRRVGGGLRWDVTIFYKHCPRWIAPHPQSVAAGVDRGVSVLAAVVDTNGTRRLVANPRPLRHAQELLKQKQQRLAATKSKGVRRQRLISEIVAAHYKIACVRRNHLHHLSRQLVDRYQILILEDLCVSKMTRSARGTLENPGRNVAAKAGLNRSILDSGWGILAEMIAYKVEETGRRLITVNPKHSSQTCPACGRIHPDNRHEQQFRCQNCGHEDHADLNAATNLLIRARHAPQRPGLGHAIPA